MSTKYTLKLIGAREDKDQKKIDLDITTDDDKKDYQIKSLSYEKRLYSPCCVNIELSRINSTDIEKDFKDRAVSLTVTEIVDKTTEKSTEIATDYFVYQYNPVYADSQCTVFLTLYSRDKLLTLDKFNKVYLNKQLGKGIIKDMLDNKTGLLKGCKVTFDVKNKLDNTTEFDAQRLQVLSYNINTGTKDKPVYTYYEVIQPYRVQYNEDFYSFISRIACQCGEFLYFEDGKLKLGLDTAGTAVDISGAILSKEYPGFGSSPLTVDNYFRNYITASSPTDGNHYSTADLPNSDYGAFDEYFDVLDGDKLPDKYKDEFYWPDVAELVKYEVIPMVGQVVWGHELYTFMMKLARLAVDAPTLFTSYTRNADSVNNKFLSDFITPNPPIAAQQKSGKQVSQFADVVQERFGKLLNAQLSKIREKEMNAARKIVRVRVKTSFAAEKAIKLGSKVTLDSKEYMVVSCTGQYFIKKIPVGLKDNVPDYWTELIDITTFDLVPAQKITISGCSTESGSLFIPPYNKCVESTPASPQSAFVTADNDPRYLGRVRVRYTWQNSNEPGSPWVRVLSPLASKSGAVHFQPKAGDEVMLGYIDGNIDRPYVAGSLFWSKSQIHDNLYTAYNDTIRVGSQRLDFRPGLITNWYNSVLPFAGMITPLIPGKMVAFTKSFDEHFQKAEEFHGITRLTDTNSIWKIEGDTAARSITIKSAWGKVKINAYTGISIESAGDISIKGKNISISAQNNIRIESGIAIKNARKSDKIGKEGFFSTLGQVVLATAQDLAFGSIDLSLIRTIWESFIPPKEGTLKIKSNRYLALEAGRGAAFDNDNIGGNDGIKRFSFDKKDWSQFINDINAIHEAVAARHLQSNAAQELEDAKNSYSPRLDQFKQLPQVEGVAGLSSINDILQNAAGIHYNIESHNDYTNIISAILTNPKTTPVTKVWAQSWKFKMQEILDKQKAYDDTVPALQGLLQPYNQLINNQYNNNNPTVEVAFQNVIKEYLNNSQAFKISNSADWETYVKELEIKEEGGWRNRISGAAEAVGTYLVEKMGLASDAEYERIYNDSEARHIAEGRILMSQDSGKSMHITGNTIKETPNVNLESVKNALRRPFPVL